MKSKEIYGGYDYRITGKVIQMLRKQKGLSQEVISGFAAIDRTHLNKIERGQHSATVETLWQISDALEMPLSELFRLVEVKTKEKEEQKQDG